MNKRIILLIAVVLTLSVTPVMSQNYLFQDDQSGFHFQGKYTDMPLPIDQYDAEIAYTFNGRFTITANYFQWRLRYTNTTDNIHFIGGGLNYLLLKQNKFPIAVSLGTSYMYSNNVEVSESAIDTVKIHEANFIINLYHKFNLNEKIAIVPSVSTSIMKRIINSTVAHSYSQSPIPLLGICTLQADLIFRSVYVFAGVDFNFYPYGYYNGYNIGLGFIIKTRS